MLPVDPLCVCGGGGVAWFLPTFANAWQARVNLANFWLYSAHRYTIPCGCAYITSWCVCVCVCVCVCTKILLLHCSVWWVKLTAKVNPHVPNQNILLVTLARIQN